MMINNFILSFFITFTAIYIFLFVRIGYIRVKQRYALYQLKRDIKFLKNKVGKVATMEGILEMIKNKKSLEELTVKKAVKGDYDKYLDIVKEVVKDQYQNFLFQMHEPVEGEIGTGWILEFQIMRTVGDYTDQYDKLFRTAIDTGIDQRETLKRFIEEVKAGNVLELGDVIIQESTTGVSPVTSGDDVRVLISFTTEELKAKSDKLVEKAKVEQEAKNKEADERIELQKEAYMEIAKTTKLVSVMGDEVVAKHPEYTEALEELKDVYGKTLG